MRWIVPVVLLALVGVGAVLYLLVDSGDSRSSHTRRADGDGAASRVEGAANGAGTGTEESREGLAVTVQVLLPDGTAAAGAHVEIAGSDSPSTEADDKGEAKLDGLHPGPYSLLARKGRAAGSLRFELTDVDRDLGTLRLDSALLVEGRVFDSMKRPLAGALVQATRADVPPHLAFTHMLRNVGRRSVVSAQALSDAEGAYKLVLPGPGYYVLWAQAKGFVARSERQRRIATDLSGIDFHLEPGLEVAGTVVDESGMPVSGATVSAAGGSAPFGGGRRISATTRADGSFQLTAPWGERAHLTVHARGYASEAVANLRIPVRDAYITLQRGVSVRVRAVEEGALRPAAGVDVVLFGFGGVRTTKTEADGVATLENLDVEFLENRRIRTLRLMVTGGEYAPKDAALQPAPVVDGVMDLGDIEVSPGGTAKGRVLDKVTGEPVPNAVVRFLGGLGFQSMMYDPNHAMSDERGRFELTRIPLEAVQLMAIHPDYVETRNSRELFTAIRGRGAPLFQEGVREIVLDLTLEPAGVVTGIVSSPDGEPVPGANVKVVSRQFALPFQTGGPSGSFSDSEGRFRIGGLKRGTKVELQAIHADFGSSERAVATPDEGVEVSLALLAPLSLLGRVVDELDQPVAGTRVTVTAEQGRGNQPRLGGGNPSSLTDENGRYVLRNVPAGPIRVSFDHRQYKPEVARLTVSESGGTDLGETVLTRGPSIAGVLIDESGEPRAGISVSVSPADLGSGGMRPGRDQEEGRSWGSDATDEEGRFALYGLREGKYVVQAFGEGIFSERPVIATGTTDARIVVLGAASLEVRVTCEGEPVGAASVRARLPSGARGAGNSSRRYLCWARTDDEGRTTLHPLPPDQPFEIVVEHPAYKTLTQKNVGVAPGMLPLTMTAGLRVAGVVVEPDGTPASGVRVTLWSGKLAIGAASVDAAGRFEVGGLDPGTLELRVTGQRSGYLPVDPLPVEPGDRDVRVVVRKGETISGRLVDREGLAVQGLRVEVLDSQGEVAAQSYVWRDDGIFLLPGLARGSYALRVYRSVSGGEREIKAEVSSVQAGTKDLTVTVDP